MPLAALEPHPHALAVLGAAASGQPSHAYLLHGPAGSGKHEAANSLLKTLEEPPEYVVLLLLTDRPTQVLPTIASRCQPVRFDPPAPADLAARLEREGAAPEQALAAARLSLGDGERALALLHGRVGSERPWAALLESAARRGAVARAEYEERLAEELQFLPKKEHKRRETEI